VFACDWDALTGRLRGIPGVRVRELHGLIVSPGESPYDAVEVTVGDG
jgi:hypothetical protein